jgi:hypothetical protein
MNRTLFYNELPVYVVPNSTVKDSKSRILTKFFELKTNERLPKIMDVLSRSTLRQFWHTRPIKQHICSISLRKLLLNSQKIAYLLKRTAWTLLNEWLLFNANSAIFQLYHGESKLIFNYMMIRSALF